MISGNRYILSEVIAAEYQTGKKGLSKSVESGTTGYTWNAENRFASIAKLFFTIKESFPPNRKIIPNKSTPFNQALVEKRVL